MSSQASQKSQNSQDYAQPIQDQQYRRRLVALAQAQQQQIFAAHEANLKLNKIQPDLSLNPQLIQNLQAQDGQQPVGKKLVSFRGQTDAQTRFNQTVGRTLQNQASSVGPPVASITELMNQIPSVSTQANIFNQSQAFSNLSTGKMKPGSRNASKQVSPRKNRKEANYGEVIISSSRGNGRNSKTTKVTRITSGQTTKRVNIGQLKYQSTSGTERKTIQIQNTSAGRNPGLREITKRRQQQPKGIDINTEKISMNNLIHLNNTGRNIVQTSSQMNNTKRSVEILNKQSINQNSQGSLQSLRQDFLEMFPNQKGSSGIGTIQSSENTIQNQIIYHQHPLNQVSAKATLSMEVLQPKPNSQSDSVRPSSPPKQNQIINRNSRKNLKPIGQKSKGQMMNMPELSRYNSQNQNSLFENTAPNATIKPIMIRKNNYVTQQQSLRRSNKLEEAEITKQKFSLPQTDTFKPSQTVALGPGELKQYLPSQDKQIIQTQRAPQQAKQQTMLGNLTQNQMPKILHSSETTLPQGNKLIKLNRSKKIVDTARRSRIQQLDYPQLNNENNIAKPNIQSSPEKISINYKNKTTANTFREKINDADGVTQSQKVQSARECNPSQNNLKRGQIFQKEQEKNGQSTVKTDMSPLNNAVKIENQMSPSKDEHIAGGEVSKPSGAFDLINELTEIQASNSAGDVTNFNQPSDIQINLNTITDEYKDTTKESQNKFAPKTDQRTTYDSNHKPDSQQRTNFNSSMQNIPRGLINTAFSLGSVASQEDPQNKPQLPLTPQKILKYYIQELTDYEKGEVLDYDMIYFLGKSKIKKVDGTQKQQKPAQSSEQKNNDNTDGPSSNSSNPNSKAGEFNHNFGYDDDKGDYKIIMGDHIAYRYEIVEFLGKGSFGTALRCIDHKEKKEVAVKIVKNKKKYYYQASVELKILQYLKQHDTEDIMNVIHIYDYNVFRKHLCMSFELLSMNLFEFLKINDFNGFDHNLIRRFAIQLLYALKYLKQLEIIHCDLKPENILLKEENKSGIKIIDFGSSTFIDEKVYTYIQSRFYRAPEIMLGIPYTTAIDMWSLGCIMAELYIGYPIFPGESENDQMSRIMEMRDVPPPEVLKQSERKQKFFNYNKETAKYDPIMLKNSRGKLRKPNGKPLDYVIGDEDPDFNDFVCKCLDWDPEKRLTPDDALKHVWVLKGLPPQVLIHHQKMHNIQTPELPESVKITRDEFLEEQNKETRRQRQTTAKQEAQKRDISKNPDQQRPQITLKTPREQSLNPAAQTIYPGTAKNITNSAKINFSSKKTFNQTGVIVLSQKNEVESQSNTARKFVIKKVNKL